MAGVSRGCWPAQGGLLPGLLVASMTGLVGGGGVVQKAKTSGEGTQPTDQLAKASLCSRPHLESKDLKGFLGADWTQADVHFKGLWFQRTSAGCVWGLCQSHLETDTLAERRPGPDDHTMEWPLHRTLPWRTRNRPWGKFKGSEEVSPKFICWSSFIPTPDAVHCYLHHVCMHFISKCEASKSPQTESFSCPLSTIQLFINAPGLFPNSPLCFFQY